MSIRSEDESTKRKLADKNIGYGGAQFKKFISDEGQNGAGKAGASPIKVQEKANVNKKEVISKITSAPAKVAKPVNLNSQTSPKKDVGGKKSSKNVPLGKGSYADKMMKRAELKLTVQNSGQNDVNPVVAFKPKTKITVANS